MTQKPAILAIDQGTTSSRAIVFDISGSPVASAQKELPQHYPRDGWVEHNPKDILRDTLAVSQHAVAEAIEAGFTVECAGITNQRETTIIWDRKTGEPIYNAIVWQDRRTADLCQNLKEQGYEQLVRDRTGLLLDPYFSASKISWILDNVEGARDAATNGDLAFGTVDTWLLWNLTGGNHFTDASNASRTALFNIHTQTWDDDMLALFKVPAEILPTVRDNCADFGSTTSLGGTIPIGGMAGDQQSATFGQGCFTPGMMKSTYGTGCFALLNTGQNPVQSTHQLLTTTAWRLEGTPTYALEGSIFVAGAAVQWLRDDMGIISTAADSEAHARSIDDNGGVYFVPAFTGMGAPWWKPDARGAIYGLSRDTGAAHLIRATLEAAAFQTHDLLTAMAKNWSGPISEVRVDGGMAENDWLMDFLADVTDTNILRPQNIETTALGAACFAGLQHGLWSSTEEISKAWGDHQTFTPNITPNQRDQLLQGWHKAIQKTLHEA